MHPELIPGWPIHSYGLMLVVAFYSAYFLSRWTAKKEGINPDKMIDVLLLAAVLGIVGSRALYVIQFNEQIHGFLDLIAIWNGGLVFYGGLITAVVGLAIYIRIRKLPLWKLADAVAPAIMLGLAFGKIGCFLNGCCWGARCDADFAFAVYYPRFIASSAAPGCRKADFGDATAHLDGRWHASVVHGAPRDIDSRADVIRYLAAPGNEDAWRNLALRWSRATLNRDGTVSEEVITGSYAFLQHLVKYPGEIGPDDTRSLPVHPAQIYESFSAFAICGLLLLVRRWRRNPGEVIAVLALLYAVARFNNENFRDDTNPVLGPLTISQTISIGVFALGLALLVWRRTRKPADA